jgi:hypothetical protein
VQDQDAALANSLVSSLEDDSLQNAVITLSMLLEHNSIFIVVMVMGWVGGGGVLLLLLMYLLYIS